MPADPLVTQWSPLLTLQGDETQLALLTLLAAQEQEAAQQATLLSERSPAW